MLGMDARPRIVPGCGPAEHIDTTRRRTAMPDGNRYERGMKVRRQVLGDAHVDRATGNTTPFDQDFQRYITETAWGDVWARPGLDHRTRHLVTLAILAALGREAEFEMHVRATRNTGVTPDDLKEVLMHVAVYAGVPAANSAFGAAKRAYAQTREEGKA
jgi:4-carboxymuconolactone decarboxylase